MIMAIKFMEHASAKYKHAQFMINDYQGATYSLFQKTIGVVDHVIL